MYTVRPMIEKPIRITVGEITYLPTDDVSTEHIWSTYCMYELNGTGISDAEFACLRNDEGMEYYFYPPTRNAESREIVVRELIREAGFDNTVPDGTRVLEVGLNFPEGEKWSRAVYFSFID